MKLFQRAREQSANDLIKTNEKYGPIDMDRGIVNPHAASGNQRYESLPAHIGKRKAKAPRVRMDDDIEKRNTMFRRFMLR